MSVAVMVLLVVALILLLLAAVGWPNPSPVALGWLGLFFYVLAQFITGYR